MISSSACLESIVASPPSSGSELETASPPDGEVTEVVKSEMIPLIASLTISPISIFSNMKLSSLSAPSST